jgi:hypothetical protein
MSGAIPPLSNTPSCRGAQFKKESKVTTLTFTFTFYSFISNKITLLTYNNAMMTY